jgi:hypothetical protein
MRPNFLAVVLLLALGLFAIVALVERGFRTQPVTATAANGDGVSPNGRHGSVSAAGNAWAKVGSAGKLKAAISTAGLGTNGGLSDAKQLSSEDADASHEEYVEQRIHELERLARESGADSLNAILLELENPDKEIRKGALEATIQFRDRSSIPRLEVIAASTADPEEKTEILEAIEYLKLPTLTERLAEQQAVTGNANPPDNSSAPSKRSWRKPKVQTQELPTKP